MTVRGIDRGSAVGLALLTLGTILGIGCGGGGRDPAPVGSFGMLSGQRVLVLPVQYVSRVPGGWIGGASTARAAARQADSEIAFALVEEGGRVSWITPEQQVAGLERRPSIEVDPYMLSADEARREGERLEDVRDPLYGEIRPLAALFDARLVLWPMEVTYESEERDAVPHLAIRTFLLDARSGDVLWYGEIQGAPGQDPASPGALAAAAQAFAIRVSP